MLSVKEWEQSVGITSLITQPRRVMTGRSFRQFDFAFRNIVLCWNIMKTFNIEQEVWKSLNVAQIRSSWQHYQWKGICMHYLWSSLFMFQMKIVVILTLILHKRTKTFRNLSAHRPDSYINKIFFSESQKM